MGKHPYEEILYRERPELYGRPRMSRIDRAAQFAPFAALTGYEAVIRETERCTDTRMELEEQEKESLDRRLGTLVRLGESAPAVEITCFVPDERKSGGAYQSITGKIKAVDLHARVIRLRDGRTITLENVVSISDVEQTNC